MEPEISNFEILKKNCMPYKNIQPIQGALWNKNCALIIEDTRVPKWAFTVKEVRDATADTIKGITIEEILKQSGFDHIDILKIDIEGSEKELFSHFFESWLEKVQVLIIELHDQIKPGCSDAFYSATSKYPFRKYTSGENIILIKSQ
jgi:FkbM family methyltransferase